MSSGRDEMMSRWSEEYKKKQEEELARWEYGNPLNVLLRKESRTCKGCKWQHTDTIFGRVLTVCTYIRKNGTRPEYKNQRCKHYREKA